MSNFKRARLLGATMLIASASAMAAVAQTQPAPAPEPKTPPPAATPAPTPQTDPARKPTMTNPDKSAAKAHPLIGLTVLSSDGNRVGTVQKVEAEADGKVKAIHIKAGGFLGLGGKIVAIPESQFSRTGDNVQVRMTSDEVNKLPEVKERS